MNKLDHTTIRYFDMFAGIGGFRAGLDRAGGYECIGHSEIDKYANAAYRRLHQPKESEVFYHDATKINTETLPEFDLLTAGFPCQSFSNAGKRKGFDDPRGNLFYEITRVAETRQPKYLLLENVPGILSHNKGRTFATMLDELCRLRYSLEWQIINSSVFVPQSRRRVYIIGYLNPRCAGQILPYRITNTKAPVQSIGGKAGLHFIDLNHNPKITNTARCLTARYNRGIGNRKGESSGVLHIREATKRGYKEAYPGDFVDLNFANNNTRRGRVGRGIAHTLDTFNKQGVVAEDGRIRRLTPRECFRLQGFTDGQIDRLLDGSSDTQAYKQAGNAVTVNVVHHLALRLKKAHEAAVVATGAILEAA